MLEVVFDPGEKGGLLFAEPFDKEARQKNNVVNIGYALDIGDITGTIDGAGRREVYKKLHSLTNYSLEDEKEHVDFLRKDEEEHFYFQVEDVKKLLDAANSGENIRIWKSDSPYSVCGYHYVCYLLKDSECQLSAVSLTDINNTLNHSLESYVYWGEVPPEKYKQFLPSEHILTVMERKKASNKWEELVKDNSALRAMINGELTSVPEDFYDFLIVNNLPDSICKVRVLLGELLGKYPIGISDTWYALRISHMISMKHLTLVNETKPRFFYDAVLIKNGNTD